jgi:transcription elongation factor Elf1
MITKYKLFENNIIRYISDGFDDCPVCGSEYDVIDINTYQCIYCDFEWYHKTSYEFVSATMNGDDVVVNKKNNKNKTYVSNGEFTCPICNLSEYSLIDSVIEDNYLIDYVKCDKCDTLWTINYIKIIESVKNINDEEIKKGNVVDITLFDLKKYKQKKAKNFNL